MCRGGRPRGQPRRAAAVIDDRGGGGGGTRLYKLKGKKTQTHHMQPARADIHVHTGTLLIAHYDDRGERGGGDEFYLMPCRRDMMPRSLLTHDCCTKTAYYTYCLAGATYCHAPAAARLLYQDRLLHLLLFLYLDRILLHSLLFHMLRPLITPTSVSYC